MSYEKKEKRTLVTLFRKKETFDRSCLVLLVAVGFVQLGNQLAVFRAEGEHELEPSAAKVSCMIPKPALDDSLKSATKLSPGYRRTLRSHHKKSKVQSAG